MSRIRSPGRREMSRELRGKLARRPTYSMKGYVPQALEEDKEFWLLFQESKRLEAQLPETQEAFNQCINKIRVRWYEVCPEDRPS